MKKHNFYAGPSILSEYTIRNTADAIINFADTGLSVLEVSHRSKEFQAVIDEATALVKEILEIPGRLPSALPGGGASMQFCMLPYNLLRKTCGLSRHRHYGPRTRSRKHACSAMSTSWLHQRTPTTPYIPKGFEVPAGVDYFHYTTNNTIYGTGNPNRSRQSTVRS